MRRKGPVPQIRDDSFMRKNATTTESKWTSEIATDVHGMSTKLTDIYPYNTKRVGTCKISLIKIYWRPTGGKCTYSLAEPLSKRQALQVEQESAAALDFDLVGNLSGDRQELC